jgi:lipoprotein signal peptidase
MNNIWKYSLVLAFSIILDQLIKGTSQSLILEDGGVSPLIGDLFFTRFKNNDFVFGLSIPLLKNYQNTISMFFSLGIIFYSLKAVVKNRNKKPLKGWAYTLIISGFFTSWLDRVSQGFTLDYLGLQFNDTIFAFSLGDIMTVLGILMITFIETRERLL